MYGPYYSPASYTGTAHVYKGVWYTVFSSGNVSLRLPTGAEVTFTSVKGVMAYIDELLDMHS